MTSPDEVHEIDIKSCIICMDENNSVLEKHPCNVCDKNSWHCCENCISKLDKCPICRADLNNNLNLDVDDDINAQDNISCFQKLTEKWYIYISNHPNLSQFLNFVNGILLFVIIAFYIIYLGKILIYIFCRSNCDDEDKSNDNKANCECYNLTKKDNYWTDLEDNIGNNVGAGLLGNIGLLILSKATCCNSQNNN